MGDGAWVNGGYFVLEPAVLNRIEGDDMPFEVRRSKAWQRTTSFAPTAIVASGSRWMPRDVRVLEALWDPARPRGRSGLRS